MEDYKKKYEEALENIKKIKAANKDNKELVDFIEYEYPKLKESEDERIRKEILSFLKEFERDHYRNLDFSSWIAWLEKQGEQKPIDKVKPKFKVGDIVRHKNGDTVTITQINTQYQIYYYKGWDGAATVHSDFSISEQDNWELIEQKPAWSEEDERIITGILMVLESWDSYHVSSAGLPSFIPKYVSWLKSLKERMKGE